MIVVLPVHPEGSTADGPTKSIMGYQNRTIRDGEYSIIQQFRRDFPGVDETQYFHFCSVKNWAHLNDKLFAEQIYVHAKLMIVDDRSVTNSLFLFFALFIL